MAPDPARFAKPRVRAASRSGGCGSCQQPLILWSEQSALFNGRLLRTVGTVVLVRCSKDRTALSDTKSAFSSGVGSMLQRRTEVALCTAPGCYFCK
eukprot:6469030-Amphidinium_carterae.1